MLRSRARGPTPCGFPTILPLTERAHRLFTQRSRRAGRTWFVTFWGREPIANSSMPMAGSRSICLTLGLPEDEAEAELRRLLLAQATLQGEEREVVAALGVEAPLTLRLQPRFVRCSKAQRRRGSGPRRGLLEESPYFHRFVAVASCGMGPISVVPAMPGSVCWPRAATSGGRLS